MTTAAPHGPRWSHVGLNCRDQKATEDFYTRHFGFRRARVVEADGVRVVFLRNGPVYLELFATDAEPLVTADKDGPAGPGTARHLAFQVDDVDAFLAAARGELEPTLGPLTFDEFIPGWKTVWVSDPDGIVVEVSQGYTDQSTEELATYA
ncbi:VOC family protein [Streptomyces sp. NPDC086519]|uniref:VOC family protein n=1 Tax=Streptomyces sp. NPDC086519 TaxID=3154863 RepID=UPI0034233282